MGGRPTNHRGNRSARYALRKNPENLTERQVAKLVWIAKTDPRLYRAYLLQEGRRTVFKLPSEDADEALTRWIGGHDAHASLRS